MEGFCRPQAHRFLSHGHPTFKGPGRSHPEQLLLTPSLLNPQALQRLNPTLVGKAHAAPLA
eukprot:1442087-Rhodomonas_salina.1